MKQITLLTVSTILLTTTLATCQIEQKGDAWRKKAFNWIYDNKHWAQKEGVPLSGPGSTVEATHTLRTLLPSIIKAVNANSVLDAGCGDFTWMQETKIIVKKYIGVDIAQGAIRENNKKYSSAKNSFYCLDITKDPLPKVDLILCRDCLAHLSYEDLTAAIRNFKKSGSTYLLASTYPKLKINNVDIKSGDFRGVNLRAYPFNLPLPVMEFEELSAETDMKRWGKHMGLWRIEDIEI